MPGSYAHPPRVVGAGFMPARGLWRGIRQAPLAQPRRRATASP